MIRVPAAVPGPVLGLHGGHASHGLLPLVTECSGGMKVDSPTFSAPLPVSLDTGISLHKILLYLIPPQPLLFGGSGLTQLALPSCKMERTLKGPTMEL